MSRMKNHPNTSSPRPPSHSQFLSGSVCEIPRLLRLFGHFWSFCKHYVFLSTFRFVSGQPSINAAHSFFLTCAGSTETRTAKRTRRPHVFMRARVPMRLRIDDSSRPVNVVAGYKNNARTPMNYVRDRHIDRLAYVCKVWRASQYVSLLQKKQEDTGRKSKGNAGRIIIQLWRCKMCQLHCAPVWRNRDCLSPWHVSIKR